MEIVPEEFQGDYDLNLIAENGTFLERIGVIYGDRETAERIARLLNDPLIALAAVEDIHKALVAQKITC